VFGKSKQEGDLRQMRIAAGKMFVGIFQFQYQTVMVCVDVDRTFENGKIFFPTGWLGVNKKHRNRTH